MAAATTSKPTNWADGPWPLIPSPLPNGQQSFKNDKKTLHPSAILAHEMSHIHNLFLRGLNSIWHQAPGIKSPQDIEDFLQFCVLWYKQVHHHHTLEEQFLFPRLEVLANKPGLMTVNIEQHRAFDTGMEEFREYCEKCTPATYSATELRRILDRFAPAFTVHMTDEIPTMMSLRDLDAAALSKLIDEGTAYAYKTGDSSILLPYMIGTFDIDYEGGAASQLNMNLLAFWMNDWWYSRKYANCWRFLPCDSRGHRRELLFAPQTA